MTADSFAIPLTAAAIVLGAVSGAAATPGHDTLAADDGPLSIHPIEHASFVMTWNGLAVYVDPVGGGERYDGFPPPDLVLITHLHGDHMSADTLAALATSDTRVVAPASVADALGEAAPSNLAILNHGESVDVRGIEVEAHPAYNLNPDRLRYHPRDRNDNSYLITVGGLRIYVSGDTEDIPEMRALEDIDAAFVCMNLPYTMTVDQAADAVLEFAPRIVYPYHFRGTDGMSDLDRFTELVSAKPDIEVRRLSWY
jgi:L-ascorbate metabolism protein UlaG (beta-lactamase superfamily)